MTEQRDTDEAYPEHLLEATQTIAELRRQRRDELPASERLVARFMRRVGRPRTILALSAFIIVWVALNLALSATHRNFDDRTFSLLNLVAQLCSLMFAVSILSSQNTIGRIDEEHTRLSLQLALILDRKVTKILTDLEELRSVQPEIETDEEPHELMETTDLHKAAQALREAEPQTSQEPQSERAD